MPSRLLVRLVLIALISSPAMAFATTNFWPLTAASSTHLGSGVVNTVYAHDEIADGAGGLFVVSDDGSYGHVQHVLANGSTAWPWYVFQLPGNTNGYGNPAIALDGSGGVMVAYETHGGGDDLRVVRLTAAGGLYPDWPAAGLSVCPSSDYDYIADIASDGDGGAFVAFVRSGPYRVYVQHVLGSGKLDANWPQGGIEVQEAGETYSAPQAFPDGEGGVMIFYVGTPYGGSNVLVSRVNVFGEKLTSEFPGSGLVIAPYGTSTVFDVVRTGDGLFGVVWSDGRSGTNQVYLDVVSNVGRVGSAPYGGLVLSNGTGSHLWPAIATNAFNEFLVAWTTSTQVMAARRQQDLSVHPAFPAGTAAVATGISAYVHHPSVSSDGGEGLLVGWRDPNEYSVLRVQRMTGAGTTPMGWGSNGQVMATSIGYVGDYQAVFPDGEGGAIAVFSDYGSLAVNRTRRDGTHGRMVAAMFTAMNDVPMDQGGKLSVYWRASEVDTTPANPVGSYMLWRRMPALAAQARLAGGVRTVTAGESLEGIGVGAIRALAEAAATTYWEYLGSTPSRGWAGYGMTVNTGADVYYPSGYVPFEVFLVETISPSGGVLATSAPDSGYSVDNLSPAAPTAFSGARISGATHLYWSPSAEPDFALYRLHRGASAGFVPSPANVVAEVTQPGFVDAFTASAYYKLVAVDVHGNASSAATLAPSQTLDASLEPAATLSFAPVSPNPARGTVALAFTLPTAARARLDVYDAQGRLARSIVDGDLPPGQHSRAWDLRDRDGRALAPGLYLARLATPAGTLVRRFAVVE